MPETTSRAQTEREHDIKALSDEIRQHRASEAVKREAADNFVEQCKAAGLDPLKGLSSEDREAFKRIDKAYKEADEQAEIAAEEQGDDQDQHAAIAATLLRGRGWVHRRGSQRNIRDARATAATTHASTDEPNHQVIGRGESLC